MAEIKPEVQKSGLLEELIFLLAGLLLLAVILARLTDYANFFGFGSVYDVWAGFWDWFFSTVWPVWKFVAGFLSVGALYLLIYSNYKLGIINKLDNAFFKPVLSSDNGVVAGGEDALQNSRWKEILEYMHSDNSSNWKVAILEADMMLDDSLRDKGFAGESLGEMLQSISKNDLTTLDDAWASHKIRNQVAHTGTDFALTQHETKRVIGLYERVLRELGVI